MGIHILVRWHLHKNNQPKPHPLRGQKQRYTHTYTHTCMYEDLYTTQLFSTWINNYIPQNCEEYDYLFMFRVIIWDCVGKCQMSWHELILTFHIIQWDVITLKTRFMGPTWGPPGADRTQVGPMLAPWILLSGYLSCMPLILGLGIDILICH